MCALFVYSTNRSPKRSFFIPFSSPGRSPERAITLSPAFALALASAAASASALANVKVFYVMGKALSGELSCPCDRSCWITSHASQDFLKYERRKTTC